MTDLPLSAELLSDAPVLMNRKAIGIELKASYYRQAKLNAEAAAQNRRIENTNGDMFAESEAAG